MSVGAIKRKLVIVGDGGCGKTSLLSVFTRGYFPTDHIPTVFENHVSEILIDRRVVNLQLWDTAGQEEYERLRILSYSKANVVLIAFAVDSRDSLLNVTEKWAPEVNNLCSGCPVLLIALKIDLRDKLPDPVNREEGEHVAEEIGARKYLECTALLGQGVDTVFEVATRAALLGKVGLPKPKRRSSSCLII